MSETARIVTEFLATRHVSCPACGYDLHGAAGGLCPECGRKIELHVTMPSYVPKGALRPLWVAGVAVLIGGVSAGGYYVAMGVRWGLASMVALQFIPTVLLSAGSVLSGIAIMVASRRGSLEQARLGASRWLAAWACLVAAYYGLWFALMLISIVF